MALDDMPRRRKNAGRTQPTKRELEVEAIWLDCGKNSLLAAQKLNICRSTVTHTLKALRIKRDREARLNAKGAKR